jgi:glycosyltransferase involved in cell wall biosynthesis
MNFPKISIVIPSYNQGQFLEETILSIINQQYPNLELFVVDGGSNDNSVGIIKKYEQYITWWVSESDKGQSDAINKGFAKATGEIITWINSDDILLPLSLNKVAQHFLTFPQKTGLIHGGTILFDEKKDIETRFNYLAPSPESYLSGMAFSQPAAFFKKKYFDKAGFLNNDLNFGMDYDLFMRLVLISTFQPVKDIFSKYRLHDQSKSIAESNKFIGDWKRSFINLCKNLSWHKELDTLQASGLYDKEINFYYKFSFEPDESLLSSLNSQKALYFHLGHVLKDLYWTGRIDEAKKLMRQMQTHFSEDWSEDDLRLKTILARLKLPAIALRVLKKIRRQVK